MLFRAWFTVAVLVAGSVLAAPPAVSKVEPPDWWTKTTLKSLQVLIRGSNLRGAKVTTKSPLKIRNAQSNELGTYLFVELIPSQKARPGSYPIRIETAEGSTEAPFELNAPLPSTGRFRGLSPDDVIYLVMPDRFANGDSSNDNPANAAGLHDRTKPRYYHGGDFDGLISKLDYLRDLGITALWLNPWYDNHDRLNERERYNNAAITDYHGYGAIDFYGVEQHFGDLAKLRQLAEEAHKRGIKIVQDQVANHTGPYHPWTADPPKSTWYNGTPASHLANDFVTWPLMDPYATPELRRRVLDGWFIDILPDLNQNDPAVRTYLIQNSLWWIGKLGLDAIRQDTLPYAPRDYWRDWIAALHREFPSVNVVGEVFDGDPAFTSFFQGGRARFDGVDSGIHTVFDFPGFFAIRAAFARGENLRAVPQTFAHDGLYTRPEMLVTFLGLHDVDRFMNERSASAEGIRLAFTLLMTARGIPLVYYGDEIGLRGGGDPDNRRDFPGGWPGDSQNAFSATGRNAEQNAIFNHLKQVITIRKATPALRSGLMRNLYSSTQQWVFERTAGGQRAIVIFNNAPQPAEIDCAVPDGSYVDRLGSLGKVDIRDGRLSVTVPARSASIFLPSP